MVGTQVGSVTVAIAADGAISFSCVVAVEPPDPDADFVPFNSKAAYFDAFRAFEFPASVSTPIAQSCFGDPGGALGIGGCIAASAGGFTLATDFVNLSEPLGPTPLGQSGAFRANWQFDLSSAPLQLQFQIIGINGSCTLSVTGANSTAEVDFEFDRTSPAQDVIRVATVREVDVDLNLIGCGGLVSEVAGMLQEHLQGLAAQAITNSLKSPVCRARTETTFEICEP